MWDVVVVDDEKQVIQGMKKIIPWEQLGLRYVGDAMDGKEGLELIRATKPSIIITDIYMPVMNGLDMVEQLRREQYQGEIIILSGYADFEYARQALRLGINDYLSKPITVQTIYEVLEKSIARLQEISKQMTEQHELHEKLMLYEPFVEKEWIKTIVAGTAERQVKHPFTQKFIQQWKGSSFLVIVLEIIRTTRVSEISLTDWSLFRFAVSNIAKEVVNSLWKEASCIDLHGQYLAILIPVPAAMAQEEVLLRTRDVGTELILSVYKYLSLKIHIGMGGLKETYEDIADSTEEAFHALAVKTSAPCSGIDFYEYGISEKRIDKSGHRPVKFYQQLAGAIKRLQEQEILDLIQQYTLGLHGDNRLSPPQIRQLGANIWTIFAYTLYDVGIVLEDLMPMLDLNKEMLALSTAEELADWLRNAIVSILGQVNRQDSIKHRQAVEFMIQYVHENYGDDLRLADLAEKVFISRSYLSNIFRDATGETFNNYVTKVRMEKAKSMIIEGKYMVYEIAERVGFKNVPYFTTLFKKSTGLNPSDFARSGAYFVEN
ncbi:response regulator transcription factor [Paenibacillus sp. N3.4]|uniref:response regulator transcription factor n=1 Tax=Paenibacillus sp. N3.4 TaxID=2603222 RepID=UPI0011CB6BE9|nr:response regulator transcription factor [Paenibacillus sp. N3.4]TXK84150.1 response regulator transcription factor [Paenibacillus sp. N3.4]